MKHICQYCFHPTELHAPHCPYKENIHYPRGMVGQIVAYTWPSGEESLVVILTETDEEGMVSVALLPKMKQLVPANRLDRLP